MKCRPRAEQISILHFTPTALAEFLRSRDRFDAAPHLRSVITSGEALSAELRDAVFRLLRAKLRRLQADRSCHRRQPLALSQR